MGQVLPLSGVTVAWQLHLKDVIGDLGRPKAEFTNGTTTKTLTSSYDRKTYVLGFKTASTNSVSAVASPKSNLWVSLLVIGLVILAIIVFLLFFPLRGQLPRVPSLEILQSLAQILLTPVYQIRYID
jgi:ATP-dependent Zn protease